MAEDEAVAGMEDRASWIPAVLRQPLSKLQAVVGITAGLLSVAGVIFPLAGFVMNPTQGEFVAVVHEARSRQPILDATVEIETPQKAIVSTLVSLDGGRIRQKLKEGQYLLRVSHPKFTAEFRRIQVIAGQTSEVHLMLAPRPAPPPPQARVVEKPGAVREFFRGLGF